MSLAEIEGMDKNTLASDCYCRCKSGQPSHLEVSAYFRWKGIFDRGLAAVLLVPGIPLIGLSIVLVRLTSKGPGIYRQTRVGIGRRIFTMYKIRTMRHDAEDETGPVWAKSNDSDDRITPVGRFLRKTHLDELPQLLNIIKGQMSLIGPRPERPEFVAALVREIPNYLDRIAIKPGIAGLAQINLDPDIDAESVRRKLVLDTEYVKHATVLLDARVLLATFLYMLRCNKDWATRITGLKREVPRLNPGSLSDEDRDAPAAATPLTPLIPAFRIVGRDPR